MTLIAGIGHAGRAGQLRFWHRNVVGGMKRHDAINGARHVAIITTTTGRIRRVFCVGDQRRCFGKLLMTPDAWFVGAVLSCYLSRGIAAVHRMAGQAVDSFTRFAVAKTFRTQDALILISSQARVAIGPETTGKRYLTHVGLATNGTIEL